LIIEGEPNNAEDKFWKKLFSKTPHRSKIYFSYGNYGSELVTRKLKSEAKQGDIVILGLDKYTLSTYRTCADILQHASRQKGFTLMRLGMPSFESIFLSYTGLPSLIRIKNQALNQPFTEVADCLRKKKNFSGKLNGYEIKLRAAGLNADIKTQERFVAWLLNQVTLTPKGIHITKADIGDCWLISCCVAHNNTKNACPYWKNSCSQGSEPNITYWDKICDLEAKSVLYYSSHKFNDLL
jgi:hypothetical protein